MRAFAAALQIFTRSDESPDSNAVVKPLFTARERHGKLRSMKEKKKLAEVVKEMAEESKKRGTRKLTDEEIQADIDAVRRQRRLRNTPVKSRR